MKAANTPNVTANIIENKPYKIGISIDSLLTNIDNGLRSFTSILVTSLTIFSAKKVS